jgi:hypothetical protein
MRSLLGIVALLFAAFPAYAGQCEDDIAKIEKALADMELSPDERAQIEDMKKQAKDLCEAGHQEEGLDVTAEAKAMLNIDQ